MDVLGLNTKSKKPQTKRSHKNKALKVVYISSPVKFQTNVSEFRALVQELTGKDSDTDRFMDVSGEVDSSELHEQRVIQHDEHAPLVPSTEAYFNYDGPVFKNSSDSVFGTSFDRIWPAMDGSFMSMLQPNFAHESALLNALNC